MPWFKKKLSARQVADALLGFVLNVPLGTIVPAMVDNATEDTHVHPRELSVESILLVLCSINVSVPVALTDEAIADGVLEHFWERYAEHLRGNVARGDPDFPRSIMDALKARMPVYGDAMMTIARSTAQAPDFGPAIDTLGTTFATCCGDESNERLRNHGVVLGGAAFASVRLFLANLLKHAKIVKLR